MHFAPPSARRTPSTARRAALTTGDGRGGAGAARRADGFGKEKKRGLLFLGGAPAWTAAVGMWQRPHRPGRAARKTLTFPGLSLLLGQVWKRRRAQRPLPPLLRGRLQLRQQAVLSSRRSPPTKAQRGRVERSSPRAGSLSAPKPAHGREGPVPRAFKPRFFSAAPGRPRRARARAACEARAAAAALSSPARLQRV